MRLGLDPLTARFDLRLDPPEAPPCPKCGGNCELDLLRGYEAWECETATCPVCFEIARADEFNWQGRCPNCRNEERCITCGFYWPWQDFNGTPWCSDCQDDLNALLAVVEGAD